MPGRGIICDKLSREFLVAGGGQAEAHPVRLPRLGPSIVSCVSAGCA